MNRTDRIARLLSIPLLLIVGVLAFNEYRDRSRLASVTAETADETAATGEYFPAAPSPTAASPSSAAPTDPSPTTTANEAEVTEVDLPDADPSAPPQEPTGTYSDGKVVLRGSVPRPEIAAGFLARAGSVLGKENVSMETTLDERAEGMSMTIEVQEQFRFPEGGVTFEPEFEALLNLGAAALQLLPEATLVVTGHTDDVGTDATNIALSQARAQVVVDWMVGKGVAPERVIARGAGESEPIADNATPEGREANRRIEAVLEGVAPA